MVNRYEVIHDVNKSDSEKAEAQKKWFVFCLFSLILFFQLASFVFPAKRSTKNESAPAALVVTVGA